MGLLAINPNFIAKIPAQKGLGEGELQAIEVVELTFIGAVEQVVFVVEYGAVVNVPVFIHSEVPVGQSRSSGVVGKDVGPLPAT